MSGKRKRGPKTPVVEEDDEDGEMSMELDDSEQDIHHGSLADLKRFYPQVFETARLLISRVLGLLR